MATNGIGASVRRKEDQRFITGTGHFTDDIDRPGQVYAYFVRSPHAHARIRGIDKSGAEAAPGVLAVFTGDDVKAAGWGNLICGWMVKSRDGSDMKAGPIRCSPRARRATSATPSPAWSRRPTIRRAMRPSCSRSTTRSCRRARRPHTPATRGAPQVHDDIARNTVYEWELGDRAAVDQAIASAAHVTRIDLVNNRLVPNAIEPRAALAEYDRGTQACTLYTTSQNPHVARLVISAFIGVAPEHKLRVIAPDVGGGFGSKIFIYPRSASVCSRRRGSAGR